MNHAELTEILQSPPTNAIQAVSTPIKKQRGGKRAGAGRKPNLSKRLAARLTPATAGEVLSEIDVMAIYRDIFKNGSRTLKAQCVKDLWDRHWGKPKQDVNVAGGIVHAHVRDPLLAMLPKEALEALAQSHDEVLAKYAKPVLDASQDGPHNQIESKPAIEAEVVTDGIAS
jgi:hypothetical protein